MGTLGHQNVPGRLPQPSVGNKNRPKCSRLTTNGHIKALKRARAPDAILAPAATRVFAARIPPHKLTKKATGKVAFVKLAP